MPKWRYMVWAPPGKYDWTIKTAAAWTRLTVQDAANVGVCLERINGENNTHSLTHSFTGCIIWHWMSIHNEFGWESAIHYQSVTTAAWVASQIIARQLLARPVAAVAGGPAGRRAVLLQLVVTVHVLRHPCENLGLVVRRTMSNPKLLELLPIRRCRLSKKAVT